MYFRGKIFKYANILFFFCSFVFMFQCSVCFYSYAVMDPLMVLGILAIANVQFHTDCRTHCVDAHGNTSGFFYLVRTRSRPNDFWRPNSILQKLKKRNKKAVPAPRSGRHTRTWTTTTTIHNIVGLVQLIYSKRKLST